MWYYKFIVCFFIDGILVALSVSMVQSLKCLRQLGTSPCAPCIVLMNQSRVRHEASSPHFRQRSKSVVSQSVAPARVTVRVTKSWARTFSFVIVHDQSERCFSWNASPAAGWSWKSSTVFPSVYKSDLCRTNCFWSAIVVVGVTPEAPSRCALAFKIFASSVSKCSWHCGNMALIRFCKGAFQPLGHSTQCSTM